MDRIFSDTLVITGEKYNHLAKVRRYKIGEKIELVKDGKVYEACVSNITKISLEIDICKELDDKDDLLRIHLFQAVTEKKKFEEVLRINSMLGVSEIIPIETKRIKPNKIKEFDNPRNQMIVEEGAELSKSFFIPAIHSVMSFDEALLYSKNFDRNIILYENEETVFLEKSLFNCKKKKDSEYHIGVFIGPEGGFEEEEVKQARKYNVSAVRIFRPIVRTEYAAFAANSIMRALLEGEAHEG